jgi:hypothetical protein
MFQRLNYNREKVVDLLADDLPEPYRIMNAKAKQITAKRGQQQQVSLSSDGVYQIVVHFHLVNYNILDDIIQWLIGIVTRILFFFF